MAPTDQERAEMVRRILEIEALPPDAERTEEWRRLNRLVFAAEDRDGER